MHSQTFCIFILDNSGFMAYFIQDFPILQENPVILMQTGYFLAFIGILAKFKNIRLWLILIDLGLNIPTF